MILIQYTIYASTKDSYLRITLWNLNMQPCKNYMYYVLCIFNN